jgi:hypothetical protein
MRKFVVAPKKTGDVHAHRPEGPRMKRFGRSGRRDWNHGLGDGTMTLEFIV